MVDFSRHIGSKKVDKRVVPKEIYDGLDRLSEKGPLRPAQEAVLDSWYQERGSDKDVIVKMHTGQGKTLVGLLALQSRMNAGSGPSLYLCPNIFLVKQTCDQAKEFGFNYRTIDKDGLPDDFLDGTSILITHIQMLFNGRTRFGIGAKATKIGTVVIDDAHACINAIRNSFTITIPREKNAYSEIRNLFSDSLADQGEGEFADILNKTASAFLAVPYWDWQDNSRETTRLLSKNTDDNFLKFVWPVLKDSIKESLCIVSGEKIEISPYASPLQAFGTYNDAGQRIFMSATINDDSSFVKSLGVSPEAVTNPVKYDKEKWSGEKMVLIPSLIDETLDREKVVNFLGKKIPHRTKGVVALTPSFYMADLWAHCGSIKATKDDIIIHAENLKAGDCEATVVFSNRYDGIDLPDDACRVLILDSKPFSEDLIDRYHEQSRGSSDVIEIKLAQSIEQGMGRHIRGEKDYGVVVLIGASLVKAIRSKQARRFYSTQTRHQIEIGLDIADFAKEDLKEGKDTLDVLRDLILQCINRNDQWKDYYTDRMDRMPGETKDVKILDVFVREKNAEELHQSGESEKAIQALQMLLDQTTTTDAEKGWYLQEMGRYAYNKSKLESNGFQVSAHKANNLLLKPKEGMKIQRLSPVGQKRVEAILGWMKSTGSNEDLLLKVNEIFDNLSFGVTADRFEQAIDELGNALGFSSERPDKQWKAGPDNLWCIRDGEYLLIECKSEVHQDRVEIYKEETGQMNNACAWFERNYPGADVHRVMIIPSGTLAEGAGFVQSVKIIRKSNLNKLRSNVRRFFGEFMNADLQNISSKRIEAALDTHHLTVSDIISRYSKNPRAATK